jgi:hypothetical protein
MVQGTYNVIKEADSESLREFSQQLVHHSKHKEVLFTMGSHIDEIDDMIMMTNDYDQTLICMFFGYMGNPWQQDMNLRINQ